jgi:hypothetical protein
VKIELVLHTPWTLAADTEAVTQAVQLPHPAPGSPVQGEYQVSGQRVAADALRCDAVGCVQVADRISQEDIALAELVRDAQTAAVAAEQQ